MLFKLRMKSNSFQAMAEAVALATDKVNVIFYTMRLLIICGQMFRQQRVEALVCLNSEFKLLLHSFVS